jgi:predicted transcriptional regulator
MKHLALAIGIIFLGIGLVQGLETGVQAPPFNLESGDNEKISLDRIKGKIVIIIYEAKNVIEQNRAFKNELTSLIDRSEVLKAQSTVLPVINCTSASWATKRIWKSNLRKNSKKENVTIYGDWDGKMFADYGIKDNTSNVVVIDANGIIRYFGSGKLDENEINKVKELLNRLVR